MFNVANRQRTFGPRSSAADLLLRSRCATPRVRLAPHQGEHAGVLLRRQLGPLARREHVPTVAAGVLSASSFATGPSCGAPPEALTFSAWVRRIEVEPVTNVLGATVTGLDLREPLDEDKTPRRRAQA